MLTSITTSSIYLMLDRRVAASLALALHELTTNAIELGQLDWTSRAAWSRYGRTTATTRRAGLG